MLKVISLLKRADGISRDDFATWVTRDHLEFARKIPGLRKYTVNLAGGDDPAFDAANELYFDDEEARVAGFASEEGKAAAADAGAHTSSRVHLLTTEFPQF
jgi:uncharacterized protein (TIGR02118 family)